MSSRCPSLETLSDDLLLSRLTELLGRSRRVESELVAHLAEVDARRLYLREACPSMHAYATERLHLSDAEAYLRITVARLSRRFPLVLAMLADGRLHLSGAARLAPHLRDSNGGEVLARAAHLSKRQIEELVAELAPRPDAPSLMRRLPARGSASPPREEDPSPPSAGSGAVVVATAPSATTAGAGAVRSLSEQRSPSPAPTPVRAEEPVPTSPGRYKIQFTASAELHDKLLRARSLLRGEVPTGDVATIVDRAVSLLVGELERRRFAAANKPRKTASDADPTPSSRRIPDPIRRVVWSRDGGQCTFHDRHGRRCSARERLEFHHVVPFARGGDHSEANVRLMCSWHNAFQAELDYGADVMSAHRRPRAGAASHSARSPGGP